MAEIAVITDLFGSLGFALAGVSPRVAGGPEEAESLVVEALERGGRPLILAVNEAWMRSLSPAVSVRMEEDPTVLPVGIPPLTPGKRADSSAYLAALVRRAIGVELHLEP